MSFLKSCGYFSSSVRHSVLLDKSFLHKGKPHKSLVCSISNSSGRNSSGRITSRRRGGGVKRKYRCITFNRRENMGYAGKVVRFEYDPYRTAFIALLYFADIDVYQYILAPAGLSVGDAVFSGESAEISVGNALPLSNIPVGTVVHNIELKCGKGGQIARSAGSYAQIMSKDGKFVNLRLNSGEVRRFFADSFATIGSISNVDNRNISLGKAGRSRLLGRRPSVRGVAMNPVDHPHGGGEGRTSGGRHPVTPWGKCTKGKKTRNNKRTDFYIVNSRHKFKN